jgi:hypothetical protein
LVTDGVDKRFDDDPKRSKGEVADIASVQAFRIMFFAENIKVRRLVLMGGEWRNLKSCFVIDNQTDLCLLF